jgi:serine/threonine-protein kinase
MPQVLPGGRAVLFTVAYGYTGAGGHIEVVSLDTGERKVVVDSGLDGRYVPTGHLLFVQQGTMMAASFDPDQLEVTGRPVPVLEGVTHTTNLSVGYANSGAGLFAVSDSGTLVYAPGGMAPDARRKFFWIDRLGRIEPLPALPKGALKFPRVSPDGRLLAFSTGGMNSSLWVHDFARETNTRLTNEGRTPFASWTPDGEHIVFGLSRGGVGNLHWMSHRGNEPLSTSEYLQQPGSWSPDGQYLAYVQWRHSEGTAIWLLDMGSRKVEPFLDTEHQYSYPDISPDGRWLAYVSDESGRWEVWVTSFPDSEQRMLVSNEGGKAPAWSPDGREIYYLFENRLMVVDADAGSELSLGRPRTLIEGPLYSGGPLREYDITPDGARFIFATSVEPEQNTPPVRELQVVLNWFEELKRLAPTE